MIQRRVALATVAGFLACGEFVPSVRQVEPGVLAVETAPGVKLEVVDWGGTGTTMVFLAGGGHTAHEFDEFAPRLTDTFRVIGITRRGIGASAGASPKGTQDDITDIAMVLDALALESVVLVGHSTGGHEAALFAMANPDRCMGVVYLDGAYPARAPGVEEMFRSTPPPAPPLMTRADSASVQSARAWIERTQGFSLPETEIRAVNEIDETGRLIGRAPRKTRRPGWLGRDPVLTWESVECPGLGLYAVTAPLQTWLPHYASRYASLSDEERERAEAYVRAFSAWTGRHREAFGRLPRTKVIEFASTGHYFFLEKPEQDLALAAIRDFVAGLDLKRGAHSARRTTASRSRGRLVNFVVVY